MLQHSATNNSLWDSCGKDLVHALTSALSTLLGSEPKTSARATAIRVSRRAIRTIGKAEHGKNALDQCITMLCAKTASPSHSNALTLGIIAGVCRRLPNVLEVVQSRKHDYIAFYLRELLGSRIQLPSYIGNALQDFFAGFIDLKDLTQDIIPAVEKALLRAPEIVLNDLVAPMIVALSDDMDLSDVLVSKLLKPLLANVKSTNAAVRGGALHTFHSVAQKCRDEKLMDKVIDEIITPLKANKLASADQRSLHAQMLAVLAPSASSAVKTTVGLTTVASKETNEAAASAELSAAGVFIAYALQHGLQLDGSVADAFAKGVADKKLPLRRLWALSLASILYPLDDEALAKEATRSFADSSIGKLVDSFNEVLANPLPSVQNGQISVACAATTLCIEQAPKMQGLKSASILKKASVVERLAVVEPKPSFLLNPRVYTKLGNADDLRWFMRALISVLPRIAKEDASSNVATAWAQAVIFLVVAGGVPATIRNEAAKILELTHRAQRSHVSEIVINGLWQWCEDAELETRDSAAMASVTGRQDLYKVVRAICPEADATTTESGSSQAGSMQHQMVKLLVLCKPQLIPRASWIELCLRTGNDPGRTVANAATNCLAEIILVTENPVWRLIPAFQNAAYTAAAELAFVAPEELTPMIVAQISRDLDSTQLADIGPTEAAIYRTPEGTAFIDVLSKQSQTQQLSKNSKDYETLKWEEELRAQLAQKKGQAKKLTADEKAKVDAQLTKEASIRQSIAELDARLRRGIGIIHGLAMAPATAAESWFGPSVKLLFDVIQAGAGLILGDTAALGYLKCADRTSSRLGPIRPFVGVATLRAADITILPENLLAEPLGDLVTRVLYRLRFLGEQRPFDAVSLSYILALMFLVLDKGGVDRASSEDADEQIVLAVEIISFHTETSTDTRLPRQRLFGCLITALQRFTQHFRDIRDCFGDLCRHVAPTLIEEETDTIVRGTIVPDSSVRGAVLKAISADLELADRVFYEEIWLACHDDVQEHVAVAQDIWEENELKVTTESASLCLPYLDSKDSQLRRAAARAITASIREHANEFDAILSKLQGSYTEYAKPRRQELDRYGMPIKKDLADPWESRHGIALAFRELAQIFPSDQLVTFVTFMIESGPLADKSTTVRDAMVDAVTALAAIKGKEQVEDLMKLCETTLASSTSSSQSQDLVQEAVVILYGALAQHLPPGDKRVPTVVQRLLSTLSTPS